MVWLQFGFQNLPGGIPKKNPILITIFIDLRLFWRPPGAPKNGEKQLGRSWAVVPFWLQKRFGEEIVFQEVNLKHFELEKFILACISEYFLYFLGF